LRVRNFLSYLEALVRPFSRRFDLSEALRKQRHAHPNKGLLSRVELGDVYHVQRQEPALRWRNEPNNTGRLKAEGDERLTGTKYDWLRNPALMDSEQHREFSQLRQSDLKTSRAWAMKETGMALYNYVYEKPARKHFQWWYSWAVRSRLEPMKKVASMLKRRFENIITYLTHPITNATSESINSKIQWVKYTARGFRNKQNFINAIYFHCGGLDLAPHTH
jgi:transposase